MRFLQSVAILLAFSVGSNGLEPVYAIRSKIDDFDAVAYLNEDKPRRESPEFALKRYLLTAGNRDHFAANND